MEIKVITCARIESKRFPGKNIKLLDRIPLIQHTINFAQKLSLPIYVFTKDQEIKESCTNCFFIKEPEHLYDIPGNILYKLIYANAYMKADIIILLPVTSPIRNIDKYKLWIYDFINSSYESAFSVYQKSRIEYKMNGAFYIMRKEALINNYDIVSDKSKIYIDNQNIDIDTLEDFKKAEEYYANKNNT